MTGVDREIQEPFDARLRRVLGTQTRAAPMPPAIADIPDSWTRERRAASLADIGKVVGVAAAAVLAVALVAQLPRVVPGARPVDAGAAAAFLGVPRAHVVETRDGAVAIRPISAREPTIEVVLVTRAESGLERHQLARFQVPTGNRLAVAVWAEPISCSRDSGLQQPNMLVGGSDPPADSVRVGPETIPLHRGLFLTVFDTLDMQYGAGVSIQLSGLPGGGSGGMSVPGSAFGRDDGCTGELRIP